jgi:phage host-nuclease inhibitor protein Gam
MVVMMPREKWTDERLDEEFTRLDKDIRELRRETSDLRTEMNARFDAMNNSINARFDAMNDSINKRFDRLQYTLIGTAVAIAIAIIASGAF